MNFRTLIYSAACCVSLFSAAPSSTWAEPIFTSIKESDCRAPSASITAAYDADGLTVQECTGVKGWRLFVASSDERSWVDIGRGSVIWSSEKEVVYNNEFGLFPNIGGAVAEWGVTSDGSPSHLIFRIAAQAGDLAVAAGKVQRVSKLFVIDLQGKEPAFCGIAKTNEEARALAARKEGCKTYLPHKPFPPK